MHAHIGIQVIRMSDTDHLYQWTPIQQTQGKMEGLDQHTRENGRSGSALKI